MRLASIPVTERLTQIIDATSQSQNTAILSKSDKPYRDDNYLEGATIMRSNRPNIRRKSTFSTHAV